MGLPCKSCQERNIECSYRRSRRRPGRSRATDHLRTLLPRSNDHLASVATPEGDAALHPEFETFRVEANQFESEVGPKCPDQEIQPAPEPQTTDHSRALLPRTSGHLAPGAASERDAALRFEFKSGCTMIHWVVFQRFDPSGLVYNGLQERYCVPLNLVDGFGDSMLQVMKHSRRMRSEPGYNQDYHNPLMMAFPAYVM